MPANQGKKWCASIDLVPFRLTHGPPSCLRSPRRAYFLLLHSLVAAVLWCCSVLWRHSEGSRRSNGRVRSTLQAPCPPCVETRLDLGGYDLLQGGGYPGVSIDGRSLTHGLTATRISRPEVAVQAALRWRAAVAGVSIRFTNTWHGSAGVSVIGPYRPCMSLPKMMLRVFRRRGTGLARASRGAPSFV